MKEKDNPQPQPLPLRAELRGGRLCVYCPLRRRFVRLTPEERVRQLFTLHLINDLGYPQPLLAHEVSLKVGTLKRRCDTVLYDLQARPRMIVEYKAPSVTLTQRALDQISRYNLTLRAPYLVLTNGAQLLCCLMDYERQSYRLLPSVPHYSQL
ncbi:MAG: type I restriction enzyme HsdR N-terminal domain-containing protein [Prevotellaceae bacterium]|nr:type I restriction enzyme HsdR N-terminal domain-containing protein [Prevotellaceae bacterium]